MKIKITKAIQDFPNIKIGQVYDVRTVIGSPNYHGEKSYIVFADDGRAIGVHGSEAEIVNAKN